MSTQLKQPSQKDAFKNLPPELKARLMDSKLPRSWRPLIIGLIVTLVAHGAIVGYIWHTGYTPREMLVYFDIIDPAKAGVPPKRQHAQPAP